MLDLERGCLLRGGQDVKLRPKSFQVLTHLVERHGCLVPKEDLIRAVWPDTFVSDDSLTKCLGEIRRVLGDDCQEMLKTVPRRGTSSMGRSRRRASTRVFPTDGHRSPCPAGTICHAGDELHWTRVGNARCGEAAS